MNKYQQLIRQTVSYAVKAGVLVAGVGIIYSAISLYADSVAGQKTGLEGKLAQDSALLANLRSQMDKSGEAEKRFVELQGNRTTDELVANFEGLQIFLRNAAARYRLSDTQITLAKEVPTDKPELKNFTYDVLLRPRLGLTFKAISDAHVFSFIHDLEHAAPGLIRIDKVELKRASRLADMTDNTISKLKQGTSELLVEGSIELTWIRFAPRENKTGPATPSTAAP